MGQLKAPSIRRLFSRETCPSCGAGKVLTPRVRNRWRRRHLVGKLCLAYRQKHPAARKKEEVGNAE